MNKVPLDYLKYIHTEPWLPWRYPEVVDYINNNVKPIDYELLAEIDRNIIDLFLWKFITYPTTSELIASLIRSARAKNVLESGMFSGFTTLHMVKAVYPHGLCTSIDLQDRRKGPDTTLPSDAMHRNDSDGICKTDIFYDLETLGHFRFLKGSVYPCTDPNVPHIRLLTSEVKKNAPYDFVFIDSSHEIEQTKLELRALWKVTEPGCMFTFHDCQDGCPMRLFVESLVEQGYFRGAVLPTCHRMDTWNPTNLGVFIRTDKQF